MEPAAGLEHDKPSDTHCDVAGAAQQDSVNADAAAVRVPPSRLTEEEAGELERFSEGRTRIEQYLALLESRPRVDAFEAFKPGDGGMQLDEMRAIWSTLDQQREAVRGWISERDRIEEEASDFDAADMESLRKLAKAASERDMSPADTDIVEMALKTLVALEKLRVILTSRYDGLSLLSSRLEWETKRRECWLTYMPLVEEIDKHVSETTRWSVPAADRSPATAGGIAAQQANLLASQHDESSSSSSSSPASQTPRHMHLELLSQESERLRAKAIAFNATLIAASGEALDAVIEQCQVPDSFLDEQDRIEDLGASLDSRAHFMLELTTQWIKADSLYHTTRSLHSEAKSLTADICNAKQSAPTREQCTLFQKRSGELTRGLEKLGDASTKSYLAHPDRSSSHMRFSYQHMPPLPQHDHWPEQAEFNQGVVAALNKELALAARRVKQAMLASSSFEIGTRAYQQATQMQRRLGQACHRCGDLEKAALGGWGPEDEPWDIKTIRVIGEATSQPDVQGSHLPRIAQLQAELTALRETAGRTKASLKTLTLQFRGESMSCETLHLETDRVSQNWDARSEQAERTLHDASALADVSTRIASIQKNLCKVDDTLAMSVAEIAAKVASQERIVLDLLESESATDIRAPGKAIMSEADLLREEQHLQQLSSQIAALQTHKLAKEAHEARESLLSHQIRLARVIQQLQRLSRWSVLVNKQGDSVRQSLLRYETLKEQGELLKSSCAALLQRKDEVSPMKTELEEVQYKVADFTASIDDFIRSQDETLIMTGAPPVVSDLGETLQLRSHDEAVRTASHGWCLHLKELRQNLADLAKQLKDSESKQEQGEDRNTPVDAEFDSDGASQAAEEPALSDSTGEAIVSDKLEASCGRDEGSPSEPVPPVNGSPANTPAKATVLLSVLSPTPAAQSAMSAEQSPCDELNLPNGESASSPSKSGHDTAPATEEGRLSGQRTSNDPLQSVANGSQSALDLEVPEISTSTDMANPQSICMTNNDEEAKDDVDPFATTAEELLADVETALSNTRSAVALCHEDMHRRDRNFSKVLLSTTSRRLPPRAFLAELRNRKIDAENSLTNRLEVIGASEAEVESALLPLQARGAIFERFSAEAAVVRQAAADARQAVQKLLQRFEDALEAEGSDAAQASERSPAAPRVSALYKPASADAQVTSSPKSFSGGDISYANGSSKLASTNALPPAANTESTLASLIARLTTGEVERQAITDGVPQQRQLLDLPTAASADRADAEWASLRSEVHSLASTRLAHAEAAKLRLLAEERAPKVHRFRLLASFSEKAVETETALGGFLELLDRAASQPPSRGSLSPQPFPDRSGSPCPSRLPLNGSVSLSSSMGAGASTSRPGHRTPSQSEWVSEETRMAVRMSMNSLEPLVEEAHKAADPVIEDVRVRDRIGQINRSYLDMVDMAREYLEPHLERSMSVLSFGTTATEDSMSVISSPRPDFLDLVEVAGDTKPSPYSSSSRQSRTTPHRRSSDQFRKMASSSTSSLSRSRTSSLVAIPPPSATANRALQRAAASAARTPDGHSSHLARRRVSDGPLPSTPGSASGTPRPKAFARTRLASITGSPSTPVGGSTRDARPASALPSTPHFRTPSALTRTPGSRLPIRSPASVSATPFRTDAAARPNRYRANPKSKLDVAVGKLVNRMPVPVKIVHASKTPSAQAKDGWKDDSGRYWVGHPDPKLCFCRILRSRTIMVRVGGGWQELTRYIMQHYDLSTSLALGNSPHGPKGSPSEQRKGLPWISAASLKEQGGSASHHSPRMGSSSSKHGTDISSPIAFPSGSTSPEIVRRSLEQTPTRRRVGSAHTSPAETRLLSYSSHRTRNDSQVSIGDVPKTPLASQSKLPRVVATSDQKRAFQLRAPMGLSPVADGSPRPAATSAREDLRDTTPSKSGSPRPRSPFHGGGGSADSSFGPDDSSGSLGAMLPLFFRREGSPAVRREGTPEAPVRRSAGGSARKRLPSQV